MGRFFTVLINAYDGNVNLSVELNSIPMDKFKRVSTFASSVFPSVKIIDETTGRTISESYIYYAQYTPPLDYGRALTFLNNICYGKKNKG